MSEAMSIPSHWLTETAAKYERAIARSKRVLAREERKLLENTGPAPGSTGATRRQIKTAFKLAREALTLTAGQRE